MKKFLFVLLAIALVAGTSGVLQAQVSVGATLGYATNIGDTTESGLEAAGERESDFSQSNGGSQGLQYGAFGQYTLLGHLFFRVGAEYTMTTFKGEFHNADYAIAGLGDGTLDGKLSSTNWAIPILIGINIPVGKANMYVGVGGMYMDSTVLLETKWVSRHTTNFAQATFKDEKLIIENTEETNTSGWGALVVIGGDVEVAPQVNLMIEAERYIWAQLGDKTTETEYTHKNAKIALDLDSTTEEEGGHAAMGNNYWTLKIGVRYSL